MATPCRTCRWCQATPIPTQATPSVPPLCVAAGAVVTYTDYFTGTEQAQAPGVQEARSAGQPCGPSAALWEPIA